MATSVRVFNGTAAQLNNINAGGVDVPAGQSVTASLSDAELVAIVSVTGGVVVSEVAIDDSEIALVAKELLGELTTATAVDLDGVPHLAAIISALETGNIDAIRNALYDIGVTSPTQYAASAWNPS